MKSSPKLQVFLAHSFDEEKPRWTDMNDMEVAEWFEDLMKRRLGWIVLSGRKAQPRPIGEKISEDINRSKAVVALFTRKHEISPSKDKWLPSPWVLCECAYALGRFEGSEYIVGGFRENGIDPNDLAMVTVGGMEIREFDRSRLEQDKEQFVSYLRDLESRIRWGPSGQMAMIPTSLPSAQVKLHKIFLVYRNGYCTVQNINEMVVHDPERFFDEYKGRMSHHIWNHRSDFPPLATMLEGSIDQRKAGAFFHAKLDYHHKKKLDIPLKVEVDKHEGRDVSFSVCFLDTNGEHLRLKHHDSIQYQYAWGLPLVYPVFEEELKELQGDEINPDTYCIAEVEANRGPIEHLTLELRFEKAARGVDRGELFSKSPAFQVGRGFAPHLKWSPARQMPLAKEEPAEYDMWYEIYLLYFPKFDGKLRVFWRPSSRKYQLRQH